MQISEQKRSIMTELSCMDKIRETLLNMLSFDQLILNVNMSVKPNKRKDFVMQSLIQYLSNKKTHFELRHQSQTQILSLTEEYISLNKQIVNLEGEKINLSTQLIEQTQKVESHQAQLIQISVEIEQNQSIFHKRFQEETDSQFQKHEARKGTNLNDIRFTYGKAYAERVEEEMREDFRKLRKNSLDKLREQIESLGLKMDEVTQKRQKCLKRIEEDVKPQYRSYEQKKKSCEDTQNRLKAELSLVSIKERQYMNQLISLIQEQFDLKNKKSSKNGNTFLTLQEQMQSCEDQTNQNELNVKAFLLEQNISNKTINSVNGQKEFSQENNSIGTINRIELLQEKQKTKEGELCQLLDQQNELSIQLECILADSEPLLKIQSEKIEQIHSVLRGQLEKMNLDANTIFNTFNLNFHTQVHNLQEMLKENNSKREQNTSKRMRCSKSMTIDSRPSKKKNLDASIVRPPKYGKITINMNLLLADQAISESVSSSSSKNIAAILDKENQWPLNTSIPLQKEGQVDQLPHSSYSKKLFSKDEDFPYQNMESLKASNNLNPRVKSKIQQIRSVSAIPSREKLTKECSLVSEPHGRKLSNISSLAQVQCGSSCSSQTNLSFHSPPSQSGSRNPSKCYGSSQSSAALRIQRIAKGDTTQNISNSKVIYNCSNNTYRDLKGFPDESSQASQSSKKHNPHAHSNSGFMNGQSSNRKFKGTDFNRSEQNITLNLSSVNQTNYTNFVAPNQHFQPMIKDPHLDNSSFALHSSSINNILLNPNNLFHQQPAFNNTNEQSSAFLDLSAINILNNNIFTNRNETSFQLTNNNYNPTAAQQQQQPNPSNPNQFVNALPFNQQTQSNQLLNDSQLKKFTHTAQKQSQSNQIHHHTRNPKVNSLTQGTTKFDTSLLLNATSFSSNANTKRSSRITNHSMYAAPCQTNAPKQDNQFVRYIEIYKKYGTCRDNFAKKQIYDPINNQSKPTSFGYAKRILRINQKTLSLEILKEEGNKKIVEQTFVKPLVKKISLCHVTSSILQFKNEYRFKQTDDPLISKFITCTHLPFSIDIDKMGKIECIALSEDDLLFLVKLF